MALHNFKPKKIALNGICFLMDIHEEWHYKDLFDMVHILWTDKLMAIDQCLYFVWFNNIFQLYYLSVAIIHFARNQ